MLHRILSSPLFKSELAGSCDAARRLWKIPPEQPIDWVAGIVPRPAEAVRAAIGQQSRVYVLIRNTTEETVIGGQRAAVVAVDRGTAVPVRRASDRQYGALRDRPVGRNGVPCLHDLATTPPPGIEFTVARGLGRTSLTASSAADAITAQAVQTVDFPALIERAYHDGIRFFLEVGPGASCTRLIGQILRGRPHAAISACRPDREPVAAIMEVLAGLISRRLPVNLAGLYGDDGKRHGGRESQSEIMEKDRKHRVRVDVRGGAFKVPALPVPRAISQVAIDCVLNGKDGETACSPVDVIKDKRFDNAPTVEERATEPGGRVVVGSIHRRSHARSTTRNEPRGRPIRSFYASPTAPTDLMGKQLAYQMKLIADFNHGTLALPPMAETRVDASLRGSRAANQWKLRIS